jgi:hypothetical protein
MGFAVRIVGLAAAVVLLALAGAAALLASDVRSWERTLRSDDALLAVSPPAATWRPPTRVPFSLAERLLGVGDDVEARRAIALFRENVSVKPLLENGLLSAAARARTEDALSAVGRSGDKARASQAETLLGVMTFGDLAPATVNTFPGATAPTTPDQAEAAIGDFQNAVRDDHQNTTAKYDLELLLRVLTAHGVRPGSSNQSGASSTGRHGAGGGVPGSGY